MVSDKKKYRVLIFGPSTLLFSDTGPEETSLKLIEARLKELEPETDWECLANVLYLAPSMAARVRSLVERERPDMAYLRPPAMQLVNDFVVNRIRERWPGLYDASTRVSEFFNKLAGGGPAGAPGARGWVFRGPRWLLVRVVGVAPALRVEEATALVRQTLDDLLRMEDLEIVYSLPSNIVPPNIGLEASLERLGRFGAAVQQYCAEKSIFCVDPPEELRKRNVVRQLADDRWHPDLEGRRVDADIVAQTIIKARARVRAATGSRAAEA